MKKTLAVLSVLSMSAALSACGMDDGNHMDHMHPHDACHAEHMKMATQYFFNKIDTNGDGMISKKENMAFARKMFAEADTNHDGMLSMDEVVAYKMKEKKEMMEEMGKPNCEDHMPPAPPRPDMPRPDSNESNRY